MKRALWLAAAGLVLACHGWVLVWTEWNRGAAPGGTVELTERELRLQPVLGDSTAVFLELRWDVDANEPDDDGAPAWLNMAKLRELGFDCRVPADSPHARDHYRSVPPALLYVVLEFDGDAANKPGRRRSTRLVAVDVGRDARQLRTQYPDTGHYVIGRGVVQPFLKHWNDREKRPLPKPRVSARIQDILPSAIFVPPPHHRMLQGLRRRPGSTKQPDENEMPPRYTVTVSWGQGYEPWIRSVRLLPAAEAQTQ